MPIHRLLTSSVLAVSLAPAWAAGQTPATQSAPTTFQAAGESDEPQLELPTVEAGLAEFLADRFSPHEPIYFLWGPDEPNIKFQFSLKYELFNPRGSLAQAAPGLTGFHLAYTQTSFWDTEAGSSPFFDTSYKPELLYLYEDPDADWLPGQSRFDLQLGLQHESNGKDGAESRSLNIAYVRPVFTFGDPGTGRGFFVAAAPRLWGYLGDLYDNPDLYEYRGYGDLKLITGWRDGLQLAAIGRLGNDWDKGALQLDLSYPLRRFLSGNLDLYLHAQYFTGYGESLLEYDEKGDSFRVGVSMVR